MAKRDKVMNELLRLEDGVELTASETAEYFERLLVEIRENPTAVKVHMVVDRCDGPTVRIGSSWDYHDMKLDIWSDIRFSKED